ncbi:MAG: glycosyltransferase [Sphingomicrobium sp.]
MNGAFDAPIGWPAMIDPPARPCDSGAVGRELAGQLRDWSIAAGVVGFMTSDETADISVVIPSYQRTELALETLQSVLDQTVPVREIIIVANGNDAHAAFWQAQASDRVRVVRVAARGQQDARNAGIETATTTWVAMLDDDDLYLPDYIERIGPAMADGRADIIASDHRKFHPDRDDKRTNFEAAPRGYWTTVRPADSTVEWSFVGKFPLRLLLKRVPIYPSTTVIRRDFALAIGGYNPKMFGILTEDIEFLIRALTYGQLSLVWRPLVRYRVHDGAFSRNSAGRTIGRWRIFEFARDNHPDLPAEFRSALDRDLPRRRREIFKLAYHRGEHDLMEEAWSKLRLLHRTPDVLMRRWASART